jgi:nitrate/nitrite transporter NarK
MFALIVAGEIVFGLPFSTARYFRPTLLDVFGFTNTQLGDLFALYGITAMIAYFPGGALADRFSARSLLTASLVATAVGGLYMATIPAAAPMALLYGYWGFTTIFLFWGALIKATRDWGGDSKQGEAFGVLEGGRGLVAFVASWLAGLVFASFFPVNVSLATAADREIAMQSVILFYSAAAVVAAALVWFTVPDDSSNGNNRINPLRGMATVLNRRLIWAQAGVIVCAYCGYKGLDNYSLYAVQVLQMDEVAGAKFSIYAGFVRPFAAILAGLVADRFGGARTIGVLFAAMLVSFGLLGIAAPVDAVMYFIYANIFVTLLAVFGLRGVYFALLEENRTPPFITGAAVGLVSLIGFTPEVFFAPITGRILDANPGLVGFQHYFLFLAAIGLIGIFVVLTLMRLRRTARPWPTGPGVK